VIAITLHRMQCVVAGCANKRAGRFLRCNPCRNGIQRYGLSSVAQKAMLDGQDGKCALCTRSISFNGTTKVNSAVVDHDHETGVVRGILCAPCNGVLGTVEVKIGVPKLMEYIDCV